jgi:hypothetical protein
MAFPHRNVGIDVEDGTASMRAVNLAMPDYRDIFNSLNASPSPAAPVPSVVSFDVRWKAKSDAKLVRKVDTANQFRSSYIDSNATIAWSAQQSGFSFTSAAAATSTPISGVIGHERNGRFFSSGEDEGGDD